MKTLKTVDFDRKSMYYERNFRYFDEIWVKFSENYEVKLHDLGKIKKNCMKKTFMLPK